MGYSEFYTTRPDLAQQGVSLMHTGMGRHGAGPSVTGELIDRDAFWFAVLARFILNLKLIVEPERSDEKQEYAFWLPLH
jgi:hypothetical protein